MSTETGPVIVFDGVCLLCNAWVDFLLRHDRRARYRFAAMQGATGRRLLQAHGLDADDPSSFLLVEGDRAWMNTVAMLRVVGGLGGAWPLIGVLRLVPSPLRDVLYRAIARNRYRLFGRTAQCRVPEPTHAARFLD